MTSIPALLLPGLDGTGRLFRGFVCSAPSRFATTVHSYPADPSLRLDNLVERLRADIREPVMIIAESFSGPIAIRLAATLPRMLLALVLVNSFATAPLSRWCRLLPWSFMFAVRPPIWAVRRYLVGDDTALAHEVQDTVSSVSASVLSARVHQLLSLPEPTDRAAIPAPVLCLRGIQDRLVASDLVSPHVTAPLLQVQERAGPHMLLQAAPSESWTAIDQFARTAGLQT
jgi:pimeloyl-ACP methyl ester carboxylesterase